MNCPIRERTADGISVGRCYYYLPDGSTCPRHGIVSEAVQVFENTGKLTDELNGYSPQDRQFPETDQS